MEQTSDIMACGCFFQTNPRPVWAQCGMHSGARKMFDKIKELQKAVGAKCEGLRSTEGKKAANELFDIVKKIELQATDSKANNKPKK